MAEFRWAEISEKEIDLNNLVRKLGQSEHGAQVVFTGTVRSTNDGKKVLAVSYDIYECLALKCFEEICAEANERSSDPLRIILVHRKGRLQVGEVSVFVGVGAPHRAEAFVASRFIIEQIKKRAPIWKKEHYEDGETEWLQGHSLCERHKPCGSGVGWGQIDTHGVR